MTTTQRTLIAVFDGRAQAEQAINNLKSVGFGYDQIRFAGHGTSTGGVFDKVKGLFSGQEARTAYNDLVSMGVPADDASYYQREYEAGHSIVAVLTNRRMQEVTDILARYGGYGASRRSVQADGVTNVATNVTGIGVRQDESASLRKGESTGVRQDESASLRMGESTGVRQDESASLRKGESIDVQEGEQHIKLREEQLRVQKQSVETGEVRLRKDVVEEHKSIDVPVTHEEVYIEHHPGSGQISDQPIGVGETYRIPVREEQVSVEKQTVVREEVFLGKRLVQETKSVSDTVRHEEAHIERKGDVNVHDSTIQDTLKQTDQRLKQ